MIMARQHINDEFKALEFIKKSLTYKNTVIKGLRKDLASWKEKFRDLENKYISLSSQQQHETQCSCVGNTFGLTHVVSFPFASEGVNEKIVIKEEECEDATMHELEDDQVVGCEIDERQEEETNKPNEKISEADERVCLESESSKACQTNRKLDDDDPTLDSGQNSFSTGTCDGEQPGSNEDFDGAVWPEDSSAAEPPRSWSTAERHLRTNAEMNVCPVEGCGFKTAFQYSLSRHRLTHTGEKPFECPVQGCGYRAKQKAHLDRHVSRHSEVREEPFHCTWHGCDFRSAVAADLYDHVRTHTEEKTYACGVEGCGFKSTQNTRLKVHMRSHLRERPFACGVRGCGYRATRLSHLTRHKRTHLQKKKQRKRTA